MMVERRYSRRFSMDCVFISRTIVGVGTVEEGGKTGGYM